MSKASAKLTKRGAESRFRVLVDELKLLTVAFPHLSEAFDKDELPVSFLLKQGADRADRLARKPAATSKAAASKKKRPAIKTGTTAPSKRR